MRALPSALILFAVLLSAPTLAQRLSVVPFTGPSGPGVRNQIIAGICDSADCVPPVKVTSGNKPDWKKAKKESVGYFVTGAVAKKGKVTTLTLQVLNKPGKPKSSKTFPVENGELSQKTLAAAITAVREVVGYGEKPAEPTTPTPAPKPAEPVRAAEPTPAPATSTEPSQAPVVIETVPEPKPERRQYFIAVELGADLVARSLSYTQATTSNVRAYSAFFVLPTAKLEVYPLALATTGILSGLGIEGGASLATWLKSSRVNSTEGFPTSTMKIDAGLLWRIMPSKTLDLALYPIVGIRLHSFKIGPLADGTTLDGVPGLNYFGVRAGIGFDVAPIDRLVIFLRAVAIPVFRSGEIISSTYFTKGSTFGLEGNVGVGVRIIKQLQVRAAFDFTRYMISFNSDPADAYQAKGATDQYIGGTATLRGEF